MVREVRAASDPVLDELDPGERQAIQLARDEHADLLLRDERAGVRVARAQGLVVTGTLGVLLQAAEHGLVNLGSDHFRLGIGEDTATFLAGLKRLDAALG